jgi:hypothetical protein
MPDRLANFPRIQKEKGQLTAPRFIHQSAKISQRHAQKPFPSPDLTDHCQSAQIHVSNRVADNPLAAHFPQPFGR